MVDDRYDGGPCIHRLDDDDCYKCLNSEISGTKWADKYCCCEGYEPFWKDGKPYWERGEDKC